MDIKQKHLLLQMLKLNKAMLKAKEMEGKSVVYFRKEVIDEAVARLQTNSDASLVLFGVKNTGQIGLELVQKLQTKIGFLFHTVDKMSERGRAIDVDLTNPLTGRIMTGSSSGGCINILKGINDLAIGTDGGGSVLGPAISTGLYAIMAKGLGLKGSKVRKSTDNINFRPGIGIISHDYELCKEAIGVLADVKKFDLQEIQNKRLKIAVPKEGAVLLPNGQDMRKTLTKAIKRLREFVDFVEIDFHDLQNRNSAISQCQDLFTDDTDIIMTMEGPIDLFGLGDSVLGSFGEIGAQIQNNSGKYLLKIANMVNATAVAIPTGNLGMGVLLIGKEGIEIGKAVITLGDIIRELYPIPELFKRYFSKSSQQEDFGFF